MENIQKIKINLLYPGRSVQNIQILSTSKIGILDNLYDNENMQMTYFYNGAILVKSHTFADYLVQNGSFIVVNHMNLIYEEKLRKISMSPRLNKIVKQMPEELTKLFDLRLNKMECRPRKFRKFLSQMNKPVFEHSRTDFNEPVHIYQSADHPSTEPLPVFWAPSPINAIQEETYNSSNVDSSNSVEQRELVQ